MPLGPSPGEDVVVTPDVIPGQAPTYPGDFADAVLPSDLLPAPTAALTQLDHGHFAAPAVASELTSSALLALSRKRLKTFASLDADTASSRPR